MKAPAFQWYAADYLADERVIQLSLEAEGAYVRLLSYCWREGSIPANPALCAPMCKYADVKIIKTALALFTRSPTQSGRLIHKRLEEERAKQEAFREKQSAHGKKGGRPRRDDEKPEKPNPLPSLSQPLTDPKPSLSPRGPSSLSSTLSSTSSNEDEREQGSSSAPEPEPLKAKTPERRLPDPPADALLFTPDTFPGLMNQATFASICTDLRLPIDLDRETYRATIQDKMRGLQMNAPATTLRSWIASFFVNEKKKGPLLTLTVGLPTKATPKDQLPKPGQEQRGQVLAFEGESDDYVNRTRKGNYQRQWPAATIHIITPR